MNESQRDLRESLLDVETINFLLRDWVKLDTKARLINAEIRKWGGNSLPQIGSEVSVFGTIGVVCDYGIQEKDGAFDRCLWVRVRSDLVKAIFSEVDEVTDESRKAQDAEFEKKLVAAGKKVERQKKERRARTVKGSHLVDEMLEIANTLTIDKKSSFYKVTGTQKGRAVYILIKGGRVDLSGFTVKDKAVNNITQAEAKDRHLGRVRGQINFTQPDSVVMESFRMILKELS